MANNRIFLKCRVCGKQFMLAKSFGAGFFADNYHGKTFLQNFNDFLDEHTFCMNDGTGECDEGDFVLEYETTPLDQIIENKPTVEAIPIEWLEKCKDRYILCCTIIDDIIEEWK